MVQKDICALFSMQLMHGRKHDVSWKNGTESLEPGVTEKYVCVLRALNPERDVCVKTLP